MTDGPTASDPFLGWPAPTDSGSTPDPQPPAETDNDDDVSGDDASEPVDGDQVAENVEAVTSPESPVNEPVEAVQEPTIEVPQGTVPQVLEWVGTDKTRAQAALDAEQATGEPRKGLTAKLGELLA